ncbi:unnamed protein product [Moneuplotes crassus]|uniref:Uncharacterized protein n=1 Tax=Euplotes crassus TaxID=5936 RepID=A0AAD1UAQ7_EUPCR|nr:unnamed protein product [Moneuplotes crassus]
MDNKSEATSVDLGNLWEDITIFAGHADPYVQASTSPNVSNHEGNIHKKFIDEIKILQTKVTELEKKYAEEKKRNELLQDKVKSMKQGLYREETHIRARVKQEVADNFQYKIQLSNMKWQEEMEFLKDKAFELNKQIMLKDKACLAVSKSNIEQEIIIANANKFLVQSSTGELNLEKVLPIPLCFHEMDKNKRGKKKKCPYFEKSQDLCISNEELQKSNKYLTQEFYDLKSLYESMTEELSESMNKGKQLEEEIELLHINYDHKINNVKSSINKAEIMLRKENAQLRRKYETLKNEFGRELKIKDLLIQRHIEYQNILKKELIMAKNILKDPILTKKAERELNYSETAIYPLKDLNRMIQNKSTEPRSFRKIESCIPQIDDSFNLKKYSLTPKEAQKFKNKSVVSTNCIFKPQKSAIAKKMLRSNYKLLQLNPSFAESKLAENNRTISLRKEEPNLVFCDTKLKIPKLVNINTTLSSERMNSISLFRNGNSNFFTQSNDG